MSNQIPATGRQYVLNSRTGYGDLKIESVPIPIPGKDQVLVKLHAASLQFRDLMIAKNQYPMFVKDNLSPGSDGAGEVWAIGESQFGGLQYQFKVGDRVAGNFTPLHINGGDVVSPNVMNSALGGPTDGVFSEWRLFPSYGLVKIPDSLSYEEASCLPCAALTAYNSLYGNPAKILIPGQWVLAQGTGGVSIFALQLAISNGCNVIITSSSDEKLAKAKSLAGDRAHLVHTINYKTKPDWDEEVLKIIPTGVHHIVEVGGSGTIEKSFASIAFGGCISSIGFVAGSAPREIPNINGMALMKSATLRGILIGSREQFIRMNAQIETNKIKPLIDRVFAFEELKEAYEYLDSQKHVGKVVLKIVK